MQYYRMKYRLCMEHSFSDVTHKHHHVIEIETVARPSTDDFVEFGHIEKLTCEILDSYQNTYLNEYEEFGGNTTIENMGEVFFKKLAIAFRNDDWILARLEISETPLRIYAIVAEDF